MNLKGSRRDQRYLGNAAKPPHNLTVDTPQNKSRRWQRLPIAFPVFVHGTDSEGRSILEFGTAINISAGGALIALKRVPGDKEILLEMPVPPHFVSPISHRMIEARVVRSHSGASHTYVGLEFKKPLSVR